MNSVNHASEIPDDDEMSVCSFVTCGETDDDDVATSQGVSSQSEDDSVSNDDPETSPPDE